MNNIEKLLNCENKNVRMFMNTILDLKDSQGFYSRLFLNIKELNENEIDNLIDGLGVQDFKDTLDIIMWLEG